MKLKIKEIFHAGLDFSDANKIARKYNIGFSFHSDKIKDAKELDDLRDYCSFVPHECDEYDLYVYQANEDGSCSLIGEIECKDSGSMHGRRTHPDDCYITKVK